MLDFDRMPQFHLVVQRIIFDGLSSSNLLSVQHENLSLNSLKDGLQLFLYHILGLNVDF